MKRTIQPVVCLTSHSDKYRHLVLCSLQEKSQWDFSISWCLNGRQRGRVWFMLWLELTDYSWHWWIRWLNRMMPATWGMILPVYRSSRTPFISCVHPSFWRVFFFKYILFFVLKFFLSFFFPSFNWVLIDFFFQQSWIDWQGNKLNRI